MDSQPHYTKEEFARRGDAIYENQLRSVLETGNEGKFVAIDIETGVYEVDSDELAASDRLLTRVPNAQVWLRRIGSRYAPFLSEDLLMKFYGSLFTIAMLDLSGQPDVRSLFAAP